MLARSFAALLLLAACAPEPVPPPFIIRATSARAGPGATRCGGYTCVERLFRGGRPFYYVDFSSEPVRAIYSRGDGRLYSVSETKPGWARARLEYDERWKGPFRAGNFIRPPRWRAGEQSIEHAEGGVRGIVIVEALISSAGTVEKTKVLKELAGESTARAEELVRRMRFHPATVFGRPVPVIWNVTVPVGLHVPGTPLRHAEPRRRRSMDDRRISRSFAPLLPRRR